MLRNKQYRSESKEVRMTESWGNSQKIKTYIYLKISFSIINRIPINSRQLIRVLQAIGKRKDEKLQ